MSYRAFIVTLKLINLQPTTTEHNNASFGAFRFLEKSRAQNRIKNKILLLLPLMRNKKPVGQFKISQYLLIIDYNLGNVYNLAVFKLKLDQTTSKPKFCEKLNGLRLSLGVYPRFRSVLDEFC